MSSKMEESQSSRESGSKANQSSIKDRDRSKERSQSNSKSSAKSSGGSANESSSSASSKSGKRSSKSSAKDSKGSVSSDKSKSKKSQDEKKPKKGKPVDNEKPAGKKESAPKKPKKSVSGSDDESSSDNEDGSSVKTHTDSEKSNSNSSEDSKGEELSDIKLDGDEGELFKKDKDDYRSLNEEGLRAKLKEIMEKFYKGRGDKIETEDGDPLWRDDDFPPLAKSLGKEVVHSDTMKQQYKNNYKWLRPHNINKDAKFYSSELSKCDLKFGNFSDAVFTGALGLLSIHQNIENIFVDVDHWHDIGYVVFQFFKNGEWRYVIVDTLLPYSLDRKSFLFSECGEPNEFWVPLVEKAYAKLNGSYQNIRGMDICEVLVDITGGVAEREHIDSEKYKETKDNTEAAALFSRIQSYLKNKYILGCVNVNQHREASAKESSDKAIYENLYYGMMGLWEFAQQSDEPRRLMKVRNYWGVEGGWTGEWCNNHEDWDRNPEIRKALLPDQRNKMKDDHIQFFMTLNDWTKEFNNWCICKVFNGNWQNYSIPGEWAGKTAGGPYPELEAMYCSKDKKRCAFSKLDTDDKWFNNPQYRIKVTKKTTTIISLMQEDKRAHEGKNKFVAVNFIVVRCAGRNTRIWEMPDESQIIVDASKTTEM